MKTEDTDGYSAVQVGYRTVPERKITRPQAGHLKKAGVEPMRKLREFRVRACTVLWQWLHLGRLALAGQALLSK